MVYLQSLNAKTIEQGKVIEKQVKKRSLVDLLADHNVTVEGRVLKTHLIQAVGEDHYKRLKSEHGKEPTVAILEECLLSRSLRSP